jgi:xanthine dehydrogenase accessory factor
VPTLLAEGMIPVLIDPQTHSLVQLRPRVVVDAIMAKRNTGTDLLAAPLVIALGPGFTVGVDCNAVVETNRGHNLGRVLWQGSAEPDTGIPGELPGVSGPKLSRVLRAPVRGYVESTVEIGEHVAEGQAIAVMRSPETGVETGANGGTGKAKDAGAVIVAPFDGVLRGIVHPSVLVAQGVKIGDVDPRAAREHCFTVSDKALAIGGGVLEAILSNFR